MREWDELETAIRDNKPDTERTILKQRPEQRTIRTRIRDKSDCEWGFRLFLLHRERHNM